MSEIVVSEAFQKVNALTQEQRDAAYAIARKRIAGDEPQPGNEPMFEDFAKHLNSKFPPSILRTITALCVLMLIAAFLPSAIRLHAIGFDTFSHAITHVESIYVAALCIVLMAETGQIIFSLAAATNTQLLQRIALWVGALICTAIALSGNAVAVGDRSLENAFAFLETYAPPVLVLITAQILKTQMLHAIEARYTAQHAFQQAHDAWKSTHVAEYERWRNIIAGASAMPTWDRTLANAMRDALRMANKRSPAVLRELTAHDWHALIMRERTAEEWWDAEEVRLRDARERIASVERAPVVRLPVRKIETEELPRVTHPGASTGATGEVASAQTLREGDTFIKVCPHCAERFEGETLRQATNRLVAHMKRHANEQRRALIEEETKPTPAVQEA